MEPGSVYCLGAHTSPEILKKLLMVVGFDRMILNFSNQQATSPSTSFLTLPLMPHNAQKLAIIQEKISVSIRSKKKFVSSLPISKGGIEI